MSLDLTLKSHLGAIEIDGKEILSASDVELTLLGSLKKSTAFSLKTKGALDAETEWRSAISARQKCP